MARVVVDRVSYRVDGAHLLQDVSLTVSSGEIVAVVGPNGAGKTTLLDIVAGDLAPTSGEVRIGARRADDPGLALERAVLPQHHLLQFAFRCIDVVMFGRYPHSTGEAEDRRVAADAMDETDTTHLSDRLFPTLSGGEQSRVSFARILAQQAPLVLLDEPTSSLDLRHQELVMTTLRGIAAAGGSVLAVLHDLNLSARYADRVALLDGGRLHSIGPPPDVLTEQAVTEVYRTAVQVIPHPEHGSPLILPIGGGTGG